MKKRRVISFEEDIISDVYKKLGEEYTEKQIGEVFKCMVWYARLLLKFTKVSKVFFRGLGYMYVNVRQAENTLRRIKNLPEKTGVIFPDKEREMKALDEKIPEIRDYLERRGKKAYRDPMGIWMDRSMRWKRMKMSYEDLQDAQEREFNLI